MSARSVVTWLQVIMAASILAAAAAPASAQSCRGAVDSLNFGVINLALGTAYNTTGSLHVTCRGTPGATVRVCQNIGAGSSGAAPGGDPRHLTNGINQLNYNIYQNAGHSTVWGSYTGPNSALQIDVPINASGTGAASAKLYAQVAANQIGLPASIYTSSFAGGEASITYDYATAGSCAAIGAAHETSTPFTVSANDANTCTISTTALNFGNIPSTVSPTSATATLSAQCSLGTAYSISLNSGLNGVTSPMQRAMQNGAYLLSYNLYQDAGHSQVWGETVGTDVSTGHTGTGSAQSITVFGLIPVQTTPAIGTYHDIVIVTVTY